MNKDGRWLPEDGSFQSSTERLNIFLINFLAFVFPTLIFLNYNHSKKY